MSSDQNQSRYWDRAAAEKEFSTPLQLALFLDYVPKYACILDHGCGYGRILRELQEAGYTNLHGTDASPKMIERACQELANINLAVTDGKQIPFTDETFDVVSLIAVLTSVIDDQAQQEMIAEIKRVLKPGGLLYINDFLLNQDERNLSRYQKYQDIYGKYGVFELPEGAVCRHHSPDWIKALLGGFEKIEYQEIIFTTMNHNQSNGFFYLGTKGYGRNGVRNNHQA